jgi:hypothetical protein
VVVATAATAFPLTVPEAPRERAEAEEARKLPPVTPITLRVLVVFLPKPAPSPPELEIEKYPGAAATPKSLVVNISFVADKLPLPKNVNLCV